MTTERDQASSDREVLDRQAALGEAVGRRPPWMSVMTAMCVFLGTEDEVRATSYELKNGTGFMPVIERHHRDHWEPYVTWNTSLPEAEATRLASDCIDHIKGRRGAGPAGGGEA